MRAEVRVEGLDELAGKLGELAGRILSEEMEHSMAISQLTIETSAINNVDKSPPGHPQVQTGLLKGSIMSEWFWTSDLLQGNTGSNVEYAPHLEYGHMTRGRTVTYLGVSASSSHLVGPYPWLQPALEENIDTIIEEFDKGVERAIRRASKT